MLLYVHMLSMYCHSTYVRTYVRTRVPWYVPWYVLEYVPWYVHVYILEYVPCHAWYVVPLVTSKYHVSQGRYSSTTKASSQASIARQVYRLPDLITTGSLGNESPISAKSCHSFSRRLLAAAVGD